MDFEEYIRQGEPGKKERAYIWRTAIGLQAVDGLETSDYLKETAIRNIEGEITIDEARQLVKAYYEHRTSRTTEDRDTEEADRASSNIVKILKEKSFSFTLSGLISIHRRIFDGVYIFAGKVRDYDITKREWVLGGDTVLYVSAPDIKQAVEYDLEQEKAFDYTGLDTDEIIKHLAGFVAGLWQIHPFGEGNTRTTAVFTIKYLRSLGFDVDNQPFVENSWYFRNALVRANYQNVVRGVKRESVFLELFFRNLLLKDTNTLKNRYLHIDLPEDMKHERDMILQSAYGKHRTSTGQVQDKMLTSDPNVELLVLAIGNQQMSVKMMMEAIGLKGRDNFLENHLSPAMDGGYVRMLYPDKPRHPRQKYLLTAKGMLLVDRLAPLSSKG